MQTVFSHIVSKRLSQEYENIATESLAFILQSNESARKGMMKLIWAADPNIPNLHFKTQQTEQQNKRIFRPDMLGYHDHRTHVFIENKFEAGLTNNQPLSYLNQLAKNTQPTVLLVVVPEVREETMWGELNRRLKEAGIQTSNLDNISGNIAYSVKTEHGPILALTSWKRLLSALESEVSDDPSKRNDLLQLRALCEAADREAFIPVSPVVVSDQRIPAFILQLNSIVRASIEKAVNENVLNLNGTLPQANFERIGQYANISTGKEVGIWFGIHFRHWKAFGRSPLWVVFSTSEWGRAHEVRSLLESVSEKEGIFTRIIDEEFIIAIDMPFGEEKDYVVRNIVDRLKWITDNLHALPPKPAKIKK